MVVGLILILSFTLVSAGDFNIYNRSDDSQTYFVVNGTSGNVGIGTSTPESKLEVRGLPQDTPMTISLSGVGTGAYDKAFQIKNSTGDIKFVIGGVTSYAGLNNIGHMTIGGGTAYPQTRIASEGNWGWSTTINRFLIDTSTVGPLTTGSYIGLTIGPTISTTAGQTATTYQGIYIEGAKSGTGTIDYVRGLYMGTMPTATTMHSLYINNVYDNYIKGDVGIGTTTPSQKLDVRGQGNFSGTIYINNATDISLFDNVLGEGSFNSSGWNRSGTNVFLANTGDSVGVGVTAPAYRLEVADVEKALNVSSVLYVNGTSGRVGIGTASPSHKLNVIGTGNFTTGVTIPNDQTYKFGGGDFIKYWSVNQSVAVGKNAGANILSSSYFGDYAGGANTGSSVTATGSYAGYLNKGNYSSGFGFEALRSNLGNNVVGIGYQAGKDNTGSSVTATGYHAGYSNSGDSLTATGYYAGQSNSGQYVTATGFYAGESNSGSSLTATGFYAGLSNTGGYLTATGYAAGQSNSGEKVTVTGYNAGYSNSGTSLTAIGYNAGHSNTGNSVTTTGYYAGYLNKGNYSTATGYDAARANTGNYLTAIGLSAGYGNTGNSVTTTGYYAGYLNKGNFSSGFGYEAIKSNTGNYVVGIGSYAGYANTGNSLTATGYAAGQSNTGDYVTATGYQAGYQNTGLHFTGIGYQAGSYNTGAELTAIGYQASMSNSNNYVTSLGVRAGQSNSGESITAIGYEAGTLNTGGEVTAIGRNTANSNTADYLTAIGYDAGYYNTGGYSTVTGYQAGYSNAGNYLTATGYYAGFQNTGISLTALGYQAGRANSGSYLIAIGDNAGYENKGNYSSGFGYEALRSNTGNDVVGIGYQAGKDNAVRDQFIVKQANVNAVPLIQGNFSSGNVGIGTTSPDGTLEVIGNAIIGAEATGLVISSDGYLSDEDDDVHISDILDMDNNAIIDINWAGSDDGAGSGLDADKLDTISSGSFLRSDVDDSLTAAIIVPTANRDEGIFGTYDSTKTQHVWSMGTAYRNSPTGANFGNLYGLAYKYNGVAGGHGVYLVNNGAEKSALGLNVWTSGRFISTIATGTAPLTVASTTKVTNLNADLLDGYHGASASTASTYALRDGSGDINTRLFRSEYDTTNPTVNYIMTQIDTAGNNYIRPSTVAQVKTALGLTSGVSGPASATNNAIARFDGTTGKIIQNSGVTINDSGSITGLSNSFATATSYISKGTGTGWYYDTYRSCPAGYPNLISCTTDYVQWQNRGGVSEVYAGGCDISGDTCRAKAYTTSSYNVIIQCRLLCAT